MRVVVAGTFGPIHDGHRALVGEALERGDDGVAVGLTSDRLARESRDREVPPLEKRRERVLSEVDRLDEWDRDVAIRRIDDEYGFAATDPSLDAIVVSPETGDAVGAINERREENGLEPLSRIVVPHVLAEDGEPISSTRLVRGEIDEHGTRS